MLITSCGGPTVVERTSTTCCWCARSTTSWCTSSGGDSAATRVAGCAGTGRMAGDTAQDHHRRPWPRLGCEHWGFLGLVLALEYPRDRLVLEHGVQRGGHDRRDRQHHQPV